MDLSSKYLFKWFVVGWRRVVEDKMYWGKFIGFLFIKYFGGSGRNNGKWVDLFGFFFDRDGDKGLEGWLFF